MGVLDAVPPQDQDKAPKDQPVPMLDVPGIISKRPKSPMARWTLFSRISQIDAEARPNLWREAFETLEKKFAMS